MSQETPVRRTAWMFWTVVALLLFVAYPLSAGPYLGLKRRGLLPKPVETCLWYVYFPVFYSIEVGRPHPPYGHYPAQEVATRYLELWLP